jgi:hypothetical protein
MKEIKKIEDEGGERIQSRWKRSEVGRRRGRGWGGEGGQMGQE